MIFIQNHARNFMINTSAIILFITVSGNYSVTEEALLGDSSKSRIDMQELYRRTVWVYGAQVGLSSAEDVDAYPTDWQTEDDLFITGPGGVAVATAPNDHVEVVVTEGREEPAGNLIVSMFITVGNAGLDVGTPADVDRLAWPSGKTALKVYCEGPRGRPSRVIFALDRVRPDR